jgi:hypothetical protein
VAERALNFWNNDAILTLVMANIDVIMPIIFPALCRVGKKKHWNQEFVALVLSVLKTFLFMNDKLFNALAASYETQN